MPGDYTAELTDEATGCYFAWNLIIEVGGETAPAIIDWTATGLSSCDADDGRLTVNAIGENLEFTYDDGASWSSSNTASGLPGGIISVGVRWSDDPDCIRWITDIFIDGGFEAVVDSVVIVDPSACAENDGSLTANGAEGQAYSIDGGITWSETGTFDNLAPGTYTMLVSDETNVCSTSLGEFVLNGTGATGLLAGIMTEDASNCEGNDGTISLVPGLEGLLFSINGGPFTAQVNYGGLFPGDYLVQAQEQDGSCGIDSVVVTIGGFPALLASIDTSSAPPCYLETTGIVFASATGGDGNYTFTWSDGGLGAERNDLPAGTHTLFVTDGRGCSDSLTVSLTERADFAAVDAMVNDTSVCATNQVDFDLGELDNDLTYLWTQPDGATTSGGQLSTNLDGLHTLLVTDSTGCSFLDSFFVNFATEQEFYVGFLLAERGLVNDTAVAIDISWPAPDSVSWSFPDPSIVDVGIIANQQWLQFTETGTFEVTMEAFSGGCAGTVSQEIQIFDTRDSIPFYDSLQTGGEIIDYALYDNPHNGVFQVDVSLAREMPVSLIVLSEAGQPLDHHRLVAREINGETFDISALPNGIYFLLIKTANSFVTLRHVKQQ